MILRCSSCNRIMVFQYEVPETFRVDPCQCNSKWDTYMEGLSKQVEEWVGGLHEETRYCWYVEQPEHKPLMRGIFHGWGSVSKPADASGCSLVQDSIALVENNTGHILSIPVKQIQFRTPKEKP